ncbi:MAG: dihydropteroate synthase [Ekhidna sp.]|uniref:dihydropteroate synthase n=1 Tax=Ekhidna sp. TaxID=2608089 RepID=UPI0032EF2508
MSPKHTINVRGEIIDLSSPKVMGIINATPDSFFSGSRKTAITDILKSAEQMLSDGATFLDVGGYSSRPAADDISEEEEISRVVVSIKAITKEFPKAIVSIDTFRSDVARRAVDAGAAIVNDISAGNLDKQMLSTVAKLNIPYIAMHMRGTPQTMKELTEYDDLLFEVMKYFSSVLHDCNRLGVKDVIIDPGFGFAKTADQSFDLLNKLDHFHHLNRPILVGVSRKSMIYRTLNLTAEEALNGTTALNTVALFKGAAILRVHDVKEAVEAVKLVSKLN